MTAYALRVFLEWGIERRGEERKRNSVFKHVQMTISPFSVAPSVALYL